MHSPDQRFATAAELREALERAMFEAKVPTTTTDVAQFWAQHMSERATRRKQAIDFAIAAAADRKRVAEMLRPPGERSPSGSYPPPATLPTPKPFDALASSSDFPAAAPQPAASPTSDAVARLTARVSEPPPPPASHVSSYATLGSAAIEASPRMSLQPPARRPLFPFIAGGVIAVVAVTVFALAVLRPPSTDPLIPAKAPPQAPTVEATAATIAPPAPPPSPASTRDAAPATVASAPPPGPAAAPVRAAPPAAAPQPPRPATPPQPTKPKNKTVDDGF
jgi:hypothetical protein